MEHEPRSYAAIVRLTDATTFVAAEYTIKPGWLEAVGCTRQQAPGNCPDGIDAYGSIVPGRREFTWGDWGTVAWPSRRVDHVRVEPGRVG